MGRIYEFRHRVLNNAALIEIARVLQATSGRRADRPTDLQDMDFARFYFTEVEGTGVGAEQRQIAARTTAAAPLQVRYFDAHGMVDQLVAILQRHTIYGVTLVRAPAPAILTFLSGMDELYFFECTTDREDLLHDRLIEQIVIPVFLWHYVDIQKNVSRTYLRSHVEPGWPPYTLARLLQKRLFLQSPVEELEFAGVHGEISSAMLWEGDARTPERSALSPTTIRSAVFEDCTVVGAGEPFSALQTLNVINCEVLPSFYSTITGVPELSLDDRERHTFWKLLTWLASSGAPAQPAWTKLTLTDPRQFSDNTFDEVLRIRPRFVNLRDLRLYLWDTPEQVLKTFSVCSFPALSFLYVLISLLDEDNRVIDFRAPILALCVWLNAHVQVAGKLASLEVVFHDGSHVISKYPGSRPFLTAAMQPLVDNWQRFAHTVILTPVEGEVFSVV